VRGLQRVMKGRNGLHQHLAGKSETISMFVASLIVVKRSMLAGGWDAHYSADH